MLLFLFRRQVFSLVEVYFLSLSLILAAVLITQREEGSRHDIIT